MTTSFHLAQALAHLLEGQLLEERKGNEKKMLQIRAVKRYTAKIKMEIEQLEKVSPSKKISTFVTEETLDNIAKESQVAQ